MTTRFVAGAHHFDAYDIEELVEKMRACPAEDYLELRDRDARHLAGALDLSEPPGGVPALADPQQMLLRLARLARGLTQRRGLEFERPGQGADPGLSAHELHALVVRLARLCKAAHDLGEPLFCLAGYSRRDLGLPREGEGPR